MHLLARLLVEQRQQRRALVLGRLLDHVGGVVGRQQAQPRAAIARRQPHDEVVLIARRQREEELLGVGARQEAEALDALLARQDVPRVLQLGGDELLLAGAWRSTSGGAIPRICPMPRQMARKKCVPKFKEWRPA